MLRWARESTHLDVETAARAANIADPERLVEAENGDGTITFRQLERLAHFCRLPLRVLYLEQPPDEGPFPVDFRSGPDRPAHFDPEVVKTLRLARERRTAALELFDDLDRELRTLPHVADDDAILAVLRPLLCTALWDQRDQRTQDWAIGARALNVTKERVESALPVLIFEFPINSRQIRGCSLYDDQLSLIVLSTQDTPNARRFTIAHELVHILSRESGICSPLSPSNDERQERRCDALASEALLPATILTDLLPTLRTMTAKRAVERLVRGYGLSYSASAVRLHQVDVISRDQLSELLDLYAHQYQQRREDLAHREGGPGYYLLQVQRLGPSFTEAVLAGVSGDVISITQGAHLLGVSPSFRSISGLRENFARTYDG